MWWEKKTFNQDKLLIYSSQSFNTVWVIDDLKRLSVWTCRLSIFLFSVKCSNYKYWVILLSDWHNKHLHLKLIFWMQLTSYCGILLIIHWEILFILYGPFFIPSQFALPQECSSIFVVLQFVFVIHASRPFLVNLVCWLCIFKLFLILNSLLRKSLSWTCWWSIFSFKPVLKILIPEGFRYITSWLYNLDVSLVLLLYTFSWFLLCVVCQRKVYNCIFCCKLKCFM